MTSDRLIPLKSARAIQTLAVSERAAREIAAALAGGTEPSTGVRLRIESSDGCCQTEHYGFSLATKPEPDEIAVESRGARVYLAPSDAQALRGAVLDFVETPEGAGFQIQDEKRNHVCGCDH